MEYHLFRLLAIQSQQKLLQKPAIQSTIKTEIPIIDEGDADAESNELVTEPVNYSEDEKSDIVQIKTEAAEKLIIGGSSELVVDTEKNANTFDGVKQSANSVSELGSMDRLDSVHSSRSSSADDSNWGLKDEDLTAIGNELICDKCSRRFKSRTGFLKHFRSIHLKEFFQSKIQCPLCSWQFVGISMFIRNCFADHLLNQILVLTFR